VRSFAEIRFRLRQEAANAWGFLHPPRLPQEIPDRIKIDCLPDAAAAAEALRGTPYADEIIALAEEILAHHFALLGHTVEMGPEIAWRRDAIHNLETGLEYFRKIPYLDVAHTGDHKLIWELNRHQHLIVLAQAWRLSGRAEFLAEIRAELESWLAQNPYNRGINWSSALEVGFRALSWIWVYHLAGEALGAAVRTRLRDGLYRHGCHLAANLSVYFSPNTHILGEALALFTIGLAFPEFPKSAQWSADGARWIGRQIDFQVRSDGSHFEQSTYYHVYALDMFLFYVILARPGEAFLDRLRAMARYLWALLGPAGEIPFLGDDDGGRLFHPYGDRRRFGRATLAASSLLLGDEFPCVREDVFPMAAWWIGASALERGGSEPRAWQGAKLFDDAGVAIVSCGVARGEHQSIVDTRAFGWGRAGHGHAHALSVVVRRGAREILIDPGTFTYVSDPEWRLRFRGTAAHNTVRIDGLDQADAAGPFAWRNLPATRIVGHAFDSSTPWLTAECISRSVTHRRTLRWLDDGLLLIVDHISGTGEHEIEQFWHLADDAARDCVRLSDAAEYRAGGEGEWRSLVFGAKQLAPVLCVRRRGGLPMTLAAVIDPEQKCALVRTEGALAVIVFSDGSERQFEAL
jgi:hypothetical protein